MYLAKLVVMSSSAFWSSRIVFVSSSSRKYFAAATTARKLNGCSFSLSAVSASCSKAYSSPKMTRWCCASICTSFRRCSSQNRRRRASVSIAHTHTHTPLPTFQTQQCLRF